MDGGIFQKGILLWYAENKRNLPWRNTTDPYQILVSEIMLQQTQVDRVIPKYQEFLNRYPTVHTLASAKTADLISLWSGLGYNRRVIHLQNAAKSIAAYGFPNSIEGMMDLPGIGPYTARAVMCFAFHKDIPVVDTNIRRIFSRYFFGGEGSLSQLHAQVNVSVPRGKGVLWNNALMDFGATVCTARKPACVACPLKESCTAFMQGNVENYLRVSPPQKRFEGSTRQYRGIVLRALTLQSPLRIAVLQKRIPLAALKLSINQMEREGLIKKKGKDIMLP
jgi:A/G-specific adenine glycosylase